MLNETLLKSDFTNKRMGMQKPIIWTVSVSRLFTLFRDISPEFSAQADITPLNIGFEQAAEEVRERLKIGHCDAIISAGSNGAYLKSHVSVPIIIVKVSGYDVMQALAKAREISDKVAIISYQEIIPSLDEFQRNFGLQIEQRSYITAEDARAQLKSLKAMGITVIVGAGLIMDLTHEVGMTGIFIYSTETIRQAFYDAIELSRISYDQKTTPIGYQSENTTKVRHTINDLIGASSVMEKVRQYIMLYARSDATVLIQGESGTGKEMVAQAIHHEYRLFNQHKRNKAPMPFVAVNCGAIPESLLEAELFGYEEGAFTGARRGGRAGLFEMANGGTLFLDEIGEMPLALQTRLLRVLEELTIVRIGGYRPLQVNVRVICATHCDLDNWVKEGRFRADLFYRLGVLRMKIPSLHERGADIYMLAERLLKLAFAGLQQSLPTFRIQQLLGCSEFFEQYSWPGNVRELRNLMERVALFCSAYADKAITPEMLINLSPERKVKIESPATIKQAGESLAEVMSYFKGDRQAVAEYLGISRTTLWRRLKQDNVGG
ncbi:propionate catabolism operon regulatory protein PrpR [Providencia burhodogranariea]|uniref:Propionate catabolism operon regulatory protein PrpR n=1 Tax=Providencia burhodogranariea DSM 19968 TaxID=1141662 RepID=K8WVT4_9GAMM|nr:propionate catabolism operon regulatory protein PrpR [Providencia burhodogranariea DSM 19968]